MAGLFLMYQHSVRSGLLSRWVAGVAVAFLCCGQAGLGVVRAANASPVESFVQESVDAGVTILQDKTLSESGRHAKFREFLLRLMDLKRIALYTLGPWRQSASQADLDTFVQDFRDFAVANYDSKIGGYGGQTLKVSGSTAHAANDYVVKTSLVDPSDTSGGPSLEVDLRVLNENGRFVVMDASVEGIWLALTQREELTSFLAQHNGDFNALHQRLRQLTAQLGGGA